MPLLRVALIGCGIISENHIRAYQKHKNRAQITVCCDVDPEKAAARAAMIGAARVSTSWQDAVCDQEIDAVEILTPHLMHTEIAVAAARAGKHILCQKPLAPTLDECRIIAEAAQQNGVTLFYGEMSRTSPAIVAARRVIESGRIGQIVGMQATYAHHQGGQYLTTPWRYNPAEAGGGQLLDGGIHSVDMMLHLGGAAQSVSAMTTRFRPELGGEDTAVVNIRFKNGALGTLFSSHAAAMWFQGARCVVFGTEGLLVLGGPTGALTLMRPDLPERAEVLLRENEDAFEAMIGSYLDTVVDGAPNASPASVALEDLALVLAAYESAETGREVSLGA